MRVSVPCHNWGFMHSHFGHVSHFGNGLYMFWEWSIYVLKEGFGDDSGN